MSSGGQLNFPLNILLQIFSYLEVNDLIELYETCHFFRILIKESKLSSICVTLGLNDTENFFWLDDELRNDSSMENMGKFVIKYINIMKSINDKILKESKESKESILTKTDIKVHESVNIAHPDSPSSNFSRLSTNSLFSDDEWNASLDETTSSPLQNKISSIESIDKLRYSKKVKDKALLFEKLMSKENDMENLSKIKQIEKSDIMFDKFNELQNLILPKSNNKKNISDLYLKQIEQSNKHIHIPRTANKPKLDSHAMITKYKEHIDMMNKSIGEPNNVEKKNSIHTNKLKMPIFK